MVAILLRVCEYQFSSIVLVIQFKQHQTCPQFFEKEVTKRVRYASRKIFAFC